MQSLFPGRIRRVQRLSLSATGLATALVLATAPLRIAAQGTEPTTSTLTTGYLAGSGFSLSCDVTASPVAGSKSPGPQGTVTFNDLTTGQPLSSATLKTPGVWVAQPVTTSVTPYPGEMAAADFDNDGKDDLAVINLWSPSSNIINVLLGNGDGSFQTPIPTDVGFSAWDMVAAHFTNSGNWDLAVVGPGTTTGTSLSGTLAILAGLGNGNFSESTYTIADYPGHVIAADFNKDGNTDLAVFGTHGNLFVFLGTGDGKFTALPVAGPTAFSYDSSAVAATLTASGFPDLVITTGTNGTVLLGNGDGTFQTSNTDGFTLPYDAGGIAAADLNGDGNEDLVLTQTDVDPFNPNFVNGGIAVLLGKGDGTFQSPVTYLGSASAPSPTVVIGDFRGIGKLDVATMWDDRVSGDSSGTVSIYLGNGDGTFGLPSNFLALGYNPAGLAAGHFSGTDSLGLAVDGAAGYGQYVSVWPEWVKFLDSPGYVQDVLFTSLVNQSHQVTCSYSGDSTYAPSTSASQTLAYQPAATPVFTPAAASYPFPITVRIADASAGTQIYYTTDGSTPTSSSTPYPAGGVPVSSSVTIKAIAAGAGWADSNVATASYTILPPPPPQIPQPTITPASGAYSSSQTVTITDSQSGATIHYTTDGSVPTASSPVYSAPISVSASTVVKAIAVASGYTNSPPTWSAYTFGQQSTTAALTITGSDPYSMSCSVSGRVITGINGPTGSVTFTDTTTGQTLGSATLAAPLQNRGWAISDLPFSSTLMSLPAPAVGDFNGDGIPDFVVQTPAGPKLYLGNGDGAFAPPVKLNGMTLNRMAVVADFNGDGNLDIATVPAVIYLGNGDGTFQPGIAPSIQAPSSCTSPLYLGVTVGDFNGDGLSDLALGGMDNTCSAEPLWTSIYLSNGDGTLTKSYTIPASPYIAGKFTASGRDDLVSLGGSQARMFISNPDGTFQQPVSYSTPFANTVLGVPGLFNNDGHLGLALVSNDLTDRNPSTLSFLLGNGDGTFQNGYNYSLSVPFTRPGTMVSGHFDGSPNLGLALFGNQNSNNVLAVINGNGNATLQNPLYYPLSSSSQNPTQAISSDLDNDGYSDIVGADQNGVTVFHNYLMSSASGSASITIDPGTIATHNFQCSYAGDTNYSASTSPGVAETYTQLATPVFSLKVGQFTGPQTVSISGSGSGASYYYTTDGSTPTTSSTLYSGPFEISTTTTLKAIAVQTGFITSKVSEAVYTFAATPQFNPPPGQFSSAQNVTITDATAGSTIFYTTDGSTPTPLSAKYTSAVPVPANATLQAMAIAPNFLNSPVASGTYNAPALNTTTTALKASAASVAINDSLTLTATITGSSPTGSVTFMAGATTLGKANVTSGSAALQTSFTTAGTYSVTASYSGDTNNSPSTSTAVSITVTAPPPTYTVTADPTTQTITAGQSATYKITVTPANGYSASTSFGCTSLPGEATCSFNPTSITPNGGPVSTTLTISTTAPQAMLDGKPGRGLPPWAPAGSLALAGLVGLLAAPRRLRRFRAMLRILSCILLLVSAAITVSACGGGSSSSGGTKDTGTPKGSYSVSVNASGSSNQSLNLTLVVQ